MNRAHRASRQEWLLPRHLHRGGRRRPRLRGRPLRRKCVGNCHSADRKSCRCVRGDGNICARRARGRDERRSGSSGRGCYLGGTAIILAKRLDVASFPTKFSLGSEDSMMGGTPPDHVSLEARIDLDHDAMTREPGAPSTKIDSVTVGATNVTPTLKKSEE